MLRVDWTRHTSLKISGDICYGASDIEVAETFEAEAAEVRKRLSVERYDAVFTSPLSRASKLCEACGFGADAVVEP
ncbi:histidine phosphatase family protein, partial [Porphyromonas sp. CAG:1061]